MLATNRYLDLIGIEPSRGAPRARQEAYLQSARQALSLCLQYAEDAWHAERCFEHCSGQLTARPLSTAIAGNEDCISTRTASAASADLAIETRSNSVGWRYRLPRRRRRSGSRASLFRSCGIGYA